METVSLLLASLGRRPCAGIVHDGHALRAVPYVDAAPNQRDSVPHHQDISTVQDGYFATAGRVA